jgi:hypothetical protein
MKSSKILAVVAMASLFAASSYADDVYGAITVKKVKNSAGVERTVAYIDDDSKVTPVITKDIEVDSVYFTREFKANTASTLMLPFNLKEVSPSWKLDAVLYDFIEVRKDCPDNCPYAVYYQQNQDEDGFKANTPYVVMANNTHKISFNMDKSASGKIVLNTTTNNNVVSKTYDGYKFNFTGTYESIVFKKPKGYYGFAGVKTSDAKIGDFVKAACEGDQCASVRPFRAYLKVTLANLNKSSVEDVEMPETIEVYLVDSDKKGTTYIGQMNTSTGEIVKEDNRWFDMKGRVLDHKPTAKGTYYNNKKKVIIK